MYKPYEIFEMLRHAAVIVGGTKTPDYKAYMDVLHAFYRWRNAVITIQLKDM